MTWLVVVYLGSLAVLLVSAFWTTNSFTGAVVHRFTTDNVVRVFTDAVFRAVTVRTVSVALLVTVICIVLAVPLALFMAKVASPQVRLLLVIAVTTPLWASYLVKACMRGGCYCPRGSGCPGRAATRRGTPAWRPPSSR
jgi:putative spermidine/putrescine transport system permease protein